MIFLRQATQGDHIRLLVVYCISLNSVQNILAVLGVVDRCHLLLNRVSRLHLFQWKRLQNKQIFDKNETDGSLNHFNRCQWLVLTHSYFCKVMHFVHFLSGKFALVFWLWNWMNYHFFRIIFIVYVFRSSQLNCTMCAVAVWRWSHYSKVRFEIILLYTQARNCKYNTATLINIFLTMPTS